MLDDCDYDKRLGANEPTDFPGKRYDTRARGEKLMEKDTPLDSSESSCKFSVFIQVFMAKTWGFGQILPILFCKIFR